MLFRFRADDASFRRSGPVSRFGLDRIVMLFRFKTDDAGFLAVVARRPQLFRVTLAHINGLGTALFPANDDWRSVVTLKPVICGKTLGRSPSLESPLGPVSAIAFRHVVNSSEPSCRMLRSPAAQCRNM